MYGYFRCSSCNAHWESAHVSKRSGSGVNAVYYKQECKKCLIMCSPYRVEDTKCSKCGKVARTCGCEKSRHSDPNKPHRSDLCEKCKLGLSCARS